LATALVLALFAGQSRAAENLALVLANRDYRTFGTVDQAFAADAAIGDLKSAGFDVRVIRNLNRKALEKVAGSIRSDISRASRVVVLVAGHVVSSGRENWLLTTDAPRLDGLLAGEYGLPLGLLADMLAEHAGSAVMLVARPQPARRVGIGLSYGYVADQDLPQGVTVFTGAPRDLVDLLRNDLLSPGTTTAQALADGAPTIEGFGYLSDTAPFLPVTAGPGGAGDLEALLWDNARTGASAAGVQAYLDRFPNGRFAGKARDLLARLARSPEDIARENETALRLSRDTRRELQRNLSLLGYDTRGIDGIFGRGTRAAVAAWQRDNGFEANGYFTREQIGTLARAAAARARKLQEEARKRREQRDREDAAYWRDHGRNGTEQGLRAYLEHYPDGLYGDIARERLQAFDEERRRTAAIAEADAWDTAARTNTIAGYQAFLKQFPDGTFFDVARGRLDALRAAQQDTARIQAAMAAERKILSNPITRILVERQLAGKGLEPGRVDGRIDSDTRKAVRRFQRAADLPVTGYVDQPTIVRLLAAQ